MSDDYIKASTVKATVHTALGLFVAWTVGCNFVDLMAVPGLSNITPVYTVRQGIRRGSSDWMSHADWSNLRNGRPVRNSAPRTVSRQEIKEALEEVTKEIDETSDNFIEDYYYKVYPCSTRHQTATAYGNCVKTRDTLIHKWTDGRRGEHYPEADVL